MLVWLFTLQEVKILKEELDTKNRQVKKETKDLEGRKEELEKFKVNNVDNVFTWCYACVGHYS